MIPHWMPVDVLLIVAAVVLIGAVLVFSVGYWAGRRDEEDRAALERRWDALGTRQEGGRR